MQTLVDAASTGSLYALIALAIGLVFRPMRDADPDTLLVASFALSVVLQQLVILIYGSRPKSISFGADLVSSLEFWGLRVPVNQLITMGAALVLPLALAVFLKKSPLGIQMRAAAEDFTMAQLLGIRANRVITVAFAISGMLGAAVSLLLVLQTGVLTFRMGVMPVIFGLFATVIGSMGSLVGAAAGGFAVGAASQILQAVLPPELRPFRDAFVFGFVILILLVRPQGLFLPSSSKERI